MGGGWGAEPPNCGGEGGIRTHGRFPYTCFPSMHLRPLGHLSGYHFDARSLRKNPLSNPAHSLERTPSTTSSRWLTPGTARRSTTEPSAPPLGSRHPNTTVFT